MKCSTALDLLMSRLGNRTEPALRANCLLEMILQQEMLENGPFLPWFTLSENASTSTVVGDRRVPLPDDFIREAEEGGLFIIDDLGEEHEVIKDEYDLLIARYGFDTTGDLATHYAVLGDYIHLFPIPSVVRTILMKYHQKLATLEDTNQFENGWLKFASDLLIAGTGLRIATMHLQDETKANLFAPEFAASQTRLYKQHIAREEANRMRQMGED